MDDIFEEKPDVAKVDASCKNVWMALGSVIAFQRIQERAIWSSYEKIMPGFVNGFWVYPNLCCKWVE